MKHKKDEVIGCQDKDYGLATEFIENHLFE
jgi:hypothetical protein